MELWRIGGIHAHGRAAAVARARVVTRRQPHSSRHGTFAGVCAAAANSQAKRWFSSSCSSSYQDRGRLFEDQVLRVMTTLDCYLQPTPASHDGGVDHQVSQWCMARGLLAVTPHAIRLRAGCMVASGPVCRCRDAVQAHQQAAGRAAIARVPRRLAALPIPHTRARVLCLRLQHLRAAVSHNPPLCA